jgi:hypothetical protein
MATVAREDFQKSLERLEALAKGQLFHTPSNSDPGGWAGQKFEGENDDPQNIDENGTDYGGVKKALALKVEKSQALTPAEVLIIKAQNPYPAIADKVAKGQQLTPAERWALKGGRNDQTFKGYIAKGDGIGKEGKTAEKISDNTVADKDDGEINHEVGKSMPGHGEPGHKCGDMCKSFGGALNGASNLQKGIEMSPILAEFARAMSIGLEGVEARVVDSVRKSLAPVVERIAQLEKSFGGYASRANEFQNGAAEALVGIGQQIAGTAEVVNKSMTGPAGGPRSVTRQGAQQDGNGQVIPLQKSFTGPGGLDMGEGALQKSQIVEMMAQMVSKGMLNPLDVIKFESTGELSPNVQAQVQGFVRKSIGG